MMISRRRILAMSAVLSLVGCGQQGGEPVPTAKTAETSDNTEVQGRGEGKDQWWDALPREAWSRYEQVAQREAWFEVYEVFPQVFAIYEPGQFEEVISYLILGEEQALLFDTGIGIGDMRSVVDQLTGLPVIVLNSHTHYDHVGGNHQFDRILGTSTGYTLRHTTGRTHDEVAEFVGPGWVWKETPQGFSVDEYWSRPFSLAATVDDGEVLDLGGVRLEILLTPGHAPDALCLLDRENRRLYTGDTFYPASLYSHLEGSSFESYQVTARRLAELQSEVDVLLPAHNEPVLEADYLTAFARAFETVQEPGAEYVLTDGHREYSFDGFSLLVSDPPPWGIGSGTDSR